MAKKDRVRRKPSIRELEASIRKSGFPFQLDVTDKLALKGWEIAPSHRVYDRVREKDCELDLVVTKRTIVSAKGTHFNAILNIAIECKDTDLPYVCFGLDHQPTVGPGYVDSDHQNCHVVTSRDKGMSGFSLMLFDKESSGIDVKAGHHQFQRPERFYIVTQPEWANNPRHWKLHVPQSLSDVQSKFSAMVSEFDGQWAGIEDKVKFEKVTRGPTFGFLFLMLLHSGKQYEWVASGPTLAPTGSTSVMMGSGSPNGRSKFIVDIVTIGAFDDAVGRIEKSFDLAAQQVATWMAANPPTVPI